MPYDPTLYLPSNMPPSSQPSRNMTGGSDWLPIPFEDLEPGPARPVDPSAARSLGLSTGSWWGEFWGTVTRPFRSFGGSGAQDTPEAGKVSLVPILALVGAFLVLPKVLK